MIYCHTSYSNEFTRGDISSYYTDDWSGLNKLNWVEFCTREEFNAQVTECSNNFGLPSATTKPTYTQSMYDDNKLPAVGMLCKHKGVNKSVIAPLDVNNKLVLISIDNDIYSLAHCYDIEPIDNRTPKEKAVDDLMGEQKALIGNCAYMRKSFGIAYDKWVK